MELLKQAVPGTKRIAVLLPEDPNTVSQQRPEVVKAAGDLGVELSFTTVRNRDYADGVREDRGKSSRLALPAATTYFVRDRKPIIDLAAKHRLPAMYEWPEQVEDGGLMSYGPSSLTATYRRIAEKIDKILEGADPGNLPVEQPSKLELVINLKTAKALGLAIPQPLLVRADRLIE